MTVTLGMRDKAKTREHVVSLINSLPDNFNAYTAATKAAEVEQNALVKKINEKAAQGFLATYNESREEISARLAEVLLKLSEDSKKFLEVIKPLLPYLPTEQDVKAKKIRES